MKLNKNEMKNILGGQMIAPNCVVNCYNGDGWLTAQFQATEQYCYNGPDPGICTPSGGMHAVCSCVGGGPA